MKSNVLLTCEGKTFLDLKRKQIYAIFIKIKYLFDIVAP